MKKLIAGILSGVMTLSLMPSLNTFAEEVTDKNLEKAITTVKGRITIPSEFSKFNFEKTSSQGQSGYNLNWSKEDGSYGTIYVTVVQDIILSYQKYDENSTYSEERRFAKLTKDELYKKADSILKKINPTVYSNIEIDKDKVGGNVNRTTVSFPIYRTENGLMVNSDNGSIEINKDTGELQSFVLSWLKGVTFKPADKILTPSAAKQAFGAEVGIEPVYAINSDYNKKTRAAKIIYQPKEDGIYIDAFSGKKSEFKPNYYGWYGGFGKSVTTNSMELYDEEAADVGGLTRQELEKVDVEKGLLTAKEAGEKLFAESSVLAIGKNPSIRSSNLSYDYFDETKYIWNLSIQFKSAENKSLWASGTVDAKTGAILSFSSYNNAENVNTFDEKGADKLVETTLKNYVGTDRITQYKLISTKTLSKDDEIISPLPIAKVGVAATTPSSQYTGREYIYHRYVNDIKVREDSLRVFVNTEGKISSFQYSYTDIKFPSPDKILTVEKALAKLYNQREMTVNHYINISEKNETTTAILYQMPSFYLNAATGKLCDYYGEDINELRYEYNDIKDETLRHIAEKLAMNGVLLPTENGKLAPDSEITKEDFSYLLRSAGLYGDIDESKGNLMKREAVKYFIDALGGKEFALLKDIYAAPFKDVSKNNEYTGYFTFAKAMKLVEAGEDGNVSPNAFLTRAEALRMIYNYLNK